MLQKAGGLFQLLAEVDFGTSYGVKSLYFKSRATVPASTGAIRLGFSDVIAWRNEANDDDLELSIEGTDLNFNGTSISIGGATVQTEITVSDTATINLSLPESDLTADIVAGSIDNSLISASAAIAFSKLASLSSGNILVGSAGNVATSVSMSGDITISNAGVTAIGTNKVSNTMLAQMPTLTIKGNNTGGTANALDLTGAQVTTLLSNFVGDSGSGGTKGLVPAPAAGDAAASKFLSANGTWLAPSGSGDVVGPASATNNGFAKFDGTTGKLLKDSSATIATSEIAAITVSRAVVSDASGFISAATTTATEIGYVSGVTSSIQTQLNQLMPAGTVLPFAGSSAPTNFLLCYGQAVSRATYSNLFTAIGTAYGTGDGSTTFNLPDLRGRLVAGLDNMGGSAASRLTATTMSPNGTTLGATGGTQTHQLTSAEMPSHTHTQNAHTHTQNAHAHNSWETNKYTTITNGSSSAAAFDGAGSTQVLNTSAVAAVNQNATATNNNTGGDGAHLNVQPTLLMNYIIKT